MRGSLFAGGQGVVVSGQAGSAGGIHSSFSSPSVVGPLSAAGNALVSLLMALPGPQTVIWGMGGGTRLGLRVMCMQQLVQDRKLCFFSENG